MLTVDIDLRADGRFLQIFDEHRNPIVGQFEQRLVKSAAFQR